MKKIFYWSPYLSNVATIRNVLNSAYSLTKYGKNSFSTYLLDVFGEWSSFKSDILNKKINYIFCCFYGHSRFRLICESS